MLELKELNHLRAFQQLLWPSQMPQHVTYPSSTRYIFSIPQGESSTLHSRTRVWREGNIHVVSCHAFNPPHSCVYEYMCMFICVYVYMVMCIYVCYVYIHACIFVCICIFMHVYLCNICACVCLHMCMCVHICMCICIYACIMYHVCICICICLYIHVCACMFVYVNAFMCVLYMHAYMCRCTCVCVCVPGDLHEAFLSIGFTDSDINQEFRGAMAWQSHRLPSHSWLVQSFICY